MARKLDYLPEKRDFMKEIKQLMPGYRINEYMLVLCPHEELRNRITQARKEFHEKFKTPHAIWGKSHVTLVRFTQYEMLEERILNRLKTVAMGYHGIKVELKDFASFPSHSIYIQVTSKEPIRNLVREIRELQRLMKMDSDHKPHFIDEPYISIASKLLPWQYEKAWPEYASRHFTGRFIADGMLLLKRKEGEKAWQILQRFEFMNLPVGIKQGELF